MALSLEIEDVDETDTVRLGDIFQNPSWELGQGQHGLMTIDVEGSPAKGSKVVLKSDGVPMFGGRLENPVQIPTVVTAPICTRLEVLYWTRLFDFAFWTKQYTTDQYLLDVLTDLMADKLTSRGFTLHGSQAAGPLLTAPFGWTRAKVTSVLKDLEQMTEGWLLDVSPAQVVRMILPGSVAAPVALSTSARNIGTLLVSQSTQVPATLITGVFGPSAQQLASQRWVADGSATSWVTDIPAAAAPGLVCVDDGVNPALLATVGSGGMFEFDVPTSTLSVGTYGTPTNGTVLTLGPTDDFPGQDGYLAQFPFEITVGSGDIEQVIPYPAVTSYPQAVSMLAAALSQGGEEPRIFSATTLEEGIRPTQALSLNVPSRGVEDVTALVRSVRADITNDELIVYTVTSEESTILQPDAMLRLKRVIGGGSSGSSVISGGSGGGGGSTASGLSAFLGGLRNAPTTLSSSEWRNVRNHVRLPARAADWSASLQVEMWTRNTGVTFKWRLHDVTTGASTAVESGFATPDNDPDDPLIVTLTCVVPAGKDHVLQVLGQDSGDDGEDAYVVGTAASL